MVNFNPGNIRNMLLVNDIRILGDEKKKESNLRPPDWYFRHSTSEFI